MTDRCWQGGKTRVRKDEATQARKGEVTQVRKGEATQARKDEHDFSDNRDHL